MTMFSSIEREVPEYEVIFEQEKCSLYSLVIPVINEGHRIISLLEKIQKINLDYLVDVIIVDGGSTDDSLENNRLKRLGVRTLILKKGIGKLGSQLRCAYDYVLTQGYEGILTIDGNDKDDPEAIPRFIDKLKEGYDFVQASRFVKGGKSINTPWSRLLAIRMIHAPILSLFSGFHWTDTTQGFRAYSKNILTDRRINIFRDNFRGYELLAYLSYRVPKLGYNCIEIGTTRRYPKGKVPTKISFIRGNLLVLCVLINVVRGRYDP